MTQRSEHVDRDAESNNLGPRRAALEAKMWSGVGSNPLPCESTFSMVWRFGWRNALTDADMWELSGMSRKGKRYPPHFFGDGLSDWGIKRFADETGLNIPTTEEWSLIGGGRCMGQVLRRQLAICPICSQSAYHSFIFQIPFLRVCPIHHVPLNNRCLSCGAPLPVYAFTPRIFQPDWGCSHCNAPIGGQPPHLASFLELREQRKALKLVFEPLVRWIENVNRLGAGFARLTLCPHASPGYARALLEGAICEIAPPPAPATSPHFKVLCLNWNLQLRRPRPEVRVGQFEKNPFPISASSDLTDAFVRISGFFDRAVKREPRPARRCTSVLVYQATICRIRQWLLERHTRLRLETSVRARPRFEGERVITQGWDQYELAYLLLRFWCEGGVGSDWTVAADPMDERGWGWVSPTFARMRNRGLRIPIRAAILAAYGTVVCTVGASKLAGDFFMLPLRDSMENILAYAYQTDYLHHVGVVIMPVVEDLMTHFPRMHIRLDENWRDGWERISELPLPLRASHLGHQAVKSRPLL
ncbi:hypothetical protein QFZ99_001436 [Paraburkholderia atlantica]|uniref:hypothetical protein n=1 Tax=Paraburkholderia atlantica TaxID=2654982 RepID=UPI003D1F6E7E